VKISCPACAAKYSIADEKVHDRLAKIRCRKCGTTIVIDGKTSPPNVYAAEAGTIETSPAAPAPDAGGGGGGEYSVDFGDNDQRTMQLSEIIAAYNAGQVTAETYVWAEGMGDWQPLGEVPQIVDALHSAASRPSGAGSRQSARPSSPPWDQPRQSDASVARAAARTGGRAAPGGDLFGSFESAGSEEDVTTSAPEPAAHQGSAGATGARNESSVLFSLSALTAAAKPSPAAASAGAASSLSSSLTASRPAAAKDDDDSGLIDLKALTAAAAKSEHDAPAQILGAPPLGVAPLGLAPLGGYGSGVEAQASPLMMPQQKNRTGLFIGAGIAIAAVVIAVAFILRPTPPPPQDATPAAMVTTPPPPPAPTPTPTPEASSPTATPPSTGTAEADDKDKPKVAAKGGSYRPRASGGGGKKPASGGGDSPSKSSGGGDSPAPKKPAAKSGGCGCASGDLMCHMKCASK
jgi:predicted Zn finger-like uncharacterized protein